MSSSSESFRTTLIMNLCSVIGAEQMSNVLRAVDASMKDYEISRKQMSLITADGVPEVVKYYLASKAIAHLSPKTLAQYRYKIEAFFGTVKKSYHDIHADDIRMYLYAYRDQHNASDRYLDNIRIVLNSFFSWLVDNDYLTKNPCAKVEHIKYQEKPREPFTQYQLEEMRFDCANIREKALVDFLFSTGCRVSECADVDLADIDWHNRSVVIRHGKGDKRRVVFFNAESELTLRKYLETRTDDDPALFVRRRAPHCRLSPRGIQNEIKKIGDRAMLHAYPHRLRHTFATSGLHSGMPLDKLQALMGHESPRTTLIYAKQDLTDLQREHQRVYA